MSHAIIIFLKGLLRKISLQVSCSKVIKFKQKIICDAKYRICGLVLSKPVCVVSSKLLFTLKVSFMNYTYYLQNPGQKTLGVMLAKFFRLLARHVLIFRNGPEHINRKYYIQFTLANFLQHQVSVHLPVQILEGNDGRKLRF